jgi:hypothetical protein
MTKAFTYQTFQSISIDCAANLFFRNSESDPGLQTPLFPNKQGKTIIGYSKVFRKNMTVIIGMREPG